MWGIGFKTADAIAMRLGIEKTAMIRVRAGISYALTEAEAGSDAASIQTSARRVTDGGDDTDRSRHADRTRRRWCDRRPARRPRR